MQRLPEVAREACASAAMTIEEVDCFVLSHIFADVSESAGRSLDLSEERTVVPAADHGHLGSASLPVALSLALQSGRLAPGAVVCLAACGAGYAWGAAVLRI